MSDLPIFNIFLVIAGILVFVAVCFSFVVKVWEWWVSGGDVTSSPANTEAQPASVEKESKPLSTSANITWRLILVLFVIAIATYDVYYSKITNWTYILFELLRIISQSINDTAKVIWNILAPLITVSIFGTPLWSISLGLLILATIAIVIYHCVIAIIRLFSPAYSDRVRYFIITTVPDAIESFALVELCTELIRAIYIIFVSILQTIIRLFDHLSKMIQDIVGFPLIHTQRWVSWVGEKVGKQVDEARLAYETEQFARMERRHEAKLAQLKRKQAKREFRAKRLREQQAIIKNT
jgi:hypothetical protein